MLTHQGNQTMDKSLRSSARAAADAIVARQSDWAKTRRLRLDQVGWIDGQDAHRNLIRPISIDDRRTFEAGAGNELATKMRAPHSSSALAYNCFAAARESEDCLRAFASLVAPTGGLTDDTPSVTFEQKRPTGWRGIPPHLDVEVAFGPDLIAVESKMTETFGSKKDPAKSLAPYLKVEAASERWAGLPNLRRAAELLADGKKRLDLLDAPQLIKHALGLSRAQRQGDVRPMALVLLWFDARELTGEARAACDRLTEELDWLRSVVAGDLTLVGLTHQRLVREYRATVGPTPATHWVSWLEERYL